MFHGNKLFAASLGVSLGVMLTMSCNSADFSGGSKKDAVVKKDSGTGPNSGTNPNSGTGTNTDNSVDNNSNGNGPGNNGSNNGPNGKGPGNNSANANGKLGNSSGSGTGTGTMGNSSDSAGAPGSNTSLAGLLNGAGGGNQVVINQPNPNTVLFGGGKLFHIGDGAAANSSCLTQVDTFPLSGTVYWFSFTVTQPGTNVTIKVGHICGVDYNDTNFLAIVPGGSSGTDFTNHQLLPVNPGDGTNEDAQIVGSNMAPGTYALAIKSTKGTAMSGQNNQDHDDFVVGQVEFDADHPITAGGVTVTSDDDCQNVVAGGAAPAQCSPSAPNPNP